MIERNGPHGPLDEALQALIGKELRSLYDSVLDEPIPNKIADLLLKLDKLDDLTAEPKASTKPGKPNGKGAGTK